MSEFILVSNVKGMATITLNRPDKRNAMNGKMIKELIHVINAFNKDESVRVLIIHGQGEHFCAGADIHWMQTVAAGSYDQNYEDAQSIADLMYLLYTFTKPTIVLAHGATLGGGLGLLAACDIAIAARDANFGFSEVKIGITPSTISPYVIKAIGERAAHFYFLTGARFNAEEACRLGLIHQVTDSDALMSAGLALANELMQNGPLALTAAKHLIRYVAKEKISPELSQKTAEHLANLRSSPEAQEGLRAFQEKRKPTWT
jgi:methylglutaconyl-CoA hydratase